MTIAVKSISQLPYLGNPQNSGVIEFEQGGMNYRVPLAILLQLFADYARASTPTSSNPFWQSTPVYSVDPVTKAVSIVAGAVGYYNGQANTLPASSSLVIPDLVDEENQRFDALLYDTQAAAYTLLIGVESANPVTPAYNATRYLLIGYVQSTGEGVSQTATPDVHVQNSDQYLDYGGASQISALQLTELYSRLENYIGYRATEAELPTPDKDSFALVGAIASIYIFELDTGIWRRSGFALRQTVYFVFDSELDTVSAEITVVGAVEVDSINYSSKLASISYEVKLDTDTSFTAQADLTALQSWIDTNVTLTTTKWQLRLLAVYAVGESAEASATLIYNQ